MAALCALATVAPAQTLTPAGMPTVNATDINASDQLGAIPATFSVDKTGAATYSMPIVAVPGTAGVTPKLSLKYDSRSGNGLLGVGWSIDGLSEITRCHQNKLQDGADKPITWGPDDRYCLDGQRLINVYLGVVYKKEIDDGDIIIAYGGVAGTPEYFRVQHKNGSYSFYGNAPTARDPNSTTPLANTAAVNGKIFANNDTSKVLTWKLRKYQDSAGNPIWYQHGWFYGFLIVEVRYAYGANTGPDNYGARIFFSYTGRPDTFDTGYVGGLAGFSNGLRINQITSEVGGTAAPTVVRTYNLSYLEQPTDAYTGPSHLSSIQECGLNNVCRTNKTQFTWAPNPTGFSAAVSGSITPGFSVSSLAIATPQITNFADFNGDGCQDLFWVAADGLHYAITNCQGAAQNTLTFTPAVFTDGSSVLTAYGTSNYSGFYIRTVDYNADGRADLLIYNVNQDSYVVLLSTPQSDGSWRLSATPLTVVAPSSHPAGGGILDEFNSFALADSNGDGLPDWTYTHSWKSGLLLRTMEIDPTQSISSSHYYRIGSEVVQGDPAGCTLSQYPTDNQRWAQLSGAGDLDGDGIADIFLMRKGSNANWWEARLLHSAGPATCYSAPRSVLPSWNAAHFGVDINQDGIADELGSNNGINADLFAINTGTGFGTVQSTNLGPLLSGQPLDFNADGYTDLVTFDTTAHKARVSLWNPSTQAFGALQDVQGIGTTVANYMMLDINGDGIPDHVAIIDNDNTHVTTNVYLGQGVNQARHVITQITDGLGAVTTINYENVQSSSHYQRLGVGTPSSNFPQTFRWGFNNWPYSMSSAANFYSAINTGFDLNGNGQSLAKQAPTFELTNPMYVVTAVDKSAPSTAAGTLGNVSTTATSRTSYYYGDGKVEGSVRGFLGFHTIKVVDEATGLQTITRYRQDFPFIGKPIFEDVYTAANQEVSSTTTSWGFVNYGNGNTTPPYLPTPEPMNTLTLLFNPDVAGNPLVHISPTSNVFDAYLNKTSTTTTTYNNDLTAVVEQTVTTYVYPTDTSNPQVYRGLPNEVTLQSNRPNLPTLTRTRDFTYYCMGSAPCPNSALSGLVYQDIVEPSKPAYTVTTQYSYDSFGNPSQAVVSGVDIVNRTTSWAYDTRSGAASLGRFRDRTTNGLNQVVSDVVSRNALGQPTSINGLNNTNTQYGYGPLGRQYLEYRNDGSYKVTLRHPGDVNCSAGTAIADYTAYSGGNSLLECFDIVGRPVRVSPLSFASGSVGRWTDTEYDAEGRVKNVTEPYYSTASVNGFTSYSYDPVGRISAIKAPDGATSTVSYNGLTTVTINPAGQTKTEVKNLTGEISTVTDYLNGQVQYGYDAEGHPLTVTTSGPTRASGVPTSIAVSYQYDDVGRKKSMTDPDKGTWTYAYDVLGELLTQTDAKGQTINVPPPTNATTPQGYDALGRLLKRIDKYASGSVEETTTWTYDTPNGVGELAGVQQTTSGYARAYTYDSLGRENGQVLSLPAEGIQNQYDAVRYFDQYGREYQTFDASGNGIQRTYNAQGYFAQANDLSNTFALGGELYAVLAMDAAGRVVNDRLGGQIMVNGYSVPLIIRGVNFDVLGRPMSIASISGGTASYIQSLTYSYYPIGSNQYGNLYQRKDGLKGLTETFTYDGLNRLTSSQVTGQAALTVSYDSFGNIINKSDQGTYSYAAGAGPHALTSVAGSANFTYDANGNNATSLGSRGIWYNTFDKPLVIVRNGYNSTFTYGPDRDYYKRVDGDSSGSTKTIYLNGVEKVYKPNGTRDERRYLPGGAYLINTYSTYTGSTLTASTKEFLLKDHLGSTDVIADGNGAVKQAMSFDAWGRRRNVTDWTALSTTVGFDNSQTSHGYTGHEMVDNLDIVHMHGRIYDARWGRMLQADPYIQDGTDTQAQNRFAYVNNNPMMHTDPSGYDMVAAIDAALPRKWTIEDTMSESVLAAGGSVYVAGGQLVMGYTTATISVGAFSVASGPSSAGSGSGNISGVGSSELLRSSTGLGGISADRLDAIQGQTPQSNGPAGTYSYQIVSETNLGQTSYNGRMIDSVQLNVQANFHPYDLGSWPDQGLTWRDMNGGMERSMGQFANIASMGIPLPFGKAAFAAKGAAAEIRGGTYLLRDSEGQVMRTGRTNDLIRREAEHARDPALSDYSFEAVHSTDVYAEQRGLEQMLHDAYSPPLNKIQPISPSNSNFDTYMKAAQDFLGR